MKIIVPMTGMGRRFIEAGYKDPKPLIKIGGKPMIEHVIKMYPGEKDFVFICNCDHIKQTSMRAELNALMPSGKIFEVEKKKWDGPVPDILLAADLIDDDEPVLVSYCDFTVNWDFKKFKKSIEKFDGAIVAYKGFHPHHLGPTFYGYMRVDKNNVLLEIKEKEPFTKNKMQEYTAAGSYYFRTGAILKKYLKEAVEKDMRTHNEYYVSLPYNLMVRDGLKTLVYEVPKFIQFGTPDDVKAFEYWREYFENYES